MMVNVYKCVGCGAVAPKLIPTCKCPTRLLYNADNKKDVVDKFRGCKNHPDRTIRENLDGDDLCLECCIAWAKTQEAEG